MKFYFIEIITENQRIIWVGKIIESDCKGNNAKSTTKHVF